MLFNIEREAALKDSDFWRVVRLFHTVLWSDMAFIWFGICNTCGGLWSNGAGKNKKNDEEHGKGCVEEGVSWLR